MSTVTLTLNPAFDLHADCPVFFPDRENLAENPRRTAGGKGLNISRALSALGRPCRSIMLLGEENAAAFVGAAEADGIRCEALRVPGRIRENLTLHTSTGETRISFEGFSAPESILADVKKRIGPIAPGTTVTFTGRLPAGVSSTAAVVFLQELQQQGAAIVADSKSLSADDLLKLKPAFIKPNAPEIAELTGRNIGSISDAADAALYFHKNGVSCSTVSLGPEGVVLACKKGLFHCNAPRVEVCSTVGAGDSAIAGFLAATESGLPAEEALRWMVAAGTAACLTPGTCPPQKEVFDILLAQTKAVFFSR